MPSQDIDRENASIAVEMLEEMPRGSSMLISENLY